MPTKQKTTKSKPVTYRFVVISDLHLHPWAAFARGDGAENQRLRRSVAVLRASLARAEVLAAPWVFAGDIVHTAGYALHVVANTLVDVLAGFPNVQKVAVWGNHDSRGVGGRITLEQTVWSMLARAVPNLLVLEPGKWHDVGGMSFSGAGAQPHPDLFQFGEQSDVGVYHATVRGSVGPSGHVFEDGIDPAELIKRHRFSIVGDVHHPQQIEAPKGQAILIPGSPEQHNFGDKGEHGWWIASITGGEPSVEFAPSGSPEFRTVDNPGQVELLHYYRVKNMPKGSKLPKNAVAIGPSPTVVTRRDTLRGASQPEEILEAWLLEDPPPGIEHSDDCAVALGGGCDCPADTTAYTAVGRTLLAAHEPVQLQPYQLVRLGISNFCSYKTATLEVRPGTYLVTGKGRDYPSNGAGKSSLFEAAYWMLFGRTTKGLTGDDVIRWGADGCLVHGILRHTVTGHTVQVRRFRGASSGLDVLEVDSRWEATSVNEMTEKLSRFLGITPDLYQALGYFSQEKLLLFASTTDGARKEMLADLIGLSAYQEAATAAGRAAAEWEAERTRLETRQQVTEERLTEERERVVAAEAAQVQWAKDCRRREAYAVRLLKEYRSAVPAVREQRISEKQAALGRELFKRQNKMDAELAKLTSVAEATPAVVRQVGLQEAKRLVESTRKDWDLATSVAKGLVTQRDVQTQHQERLQQRHRAQHQVLVAGRCPTCRQEVTSDHWQQCLAPLQAEINEACMAIQVTNADLEAALEVVPELKRRAQDTALLLTKVQEYVQLSARITTLTEELADGRKEEEGLEAVVTKEIEREMGREEATLAADIDLIAAAVNPHDAEVTGLQTRIAAAEALGTKLVSELAAVSQQHAICVYWARGFSKQGLQSLLVEEVATLFNEARGDIFPALTQGVYDVQFSVVSRTKAGDARERTEFLVFEHGKQVPYEALSGGQRRRVDVGVMLTLVMAVAAWMDVPGVLGVLVLDEVFGFLDASGAEGLMEALRIVQSRIPAVYAVAHDPNLQALFPSVVHVEQDADGISHLRNGDG